MANRFARLLAGAAATALMLMGGSPPTLHATPAPAKPQPTRPNVVLILLDDVGFSDIGAFGGEIPTPNIDALAKGGVSFTQFYNAARCSPSRASLLTGTYPHQAGMGHLEALRVDGSQGLHGRLDERVVTLAEVLGSAGYFTAMAGKWHLGMSRGVGPWQRGFQRSLASPTGGIYYPDQPQRSGRNLFLDGRQLPANSPEIGRGHWYSSDLFVDWNIRFLDQARGERKPFFLYLPFVAGHFPLMAPPEEIARFKGRYRRGWDPIRRERLERQKALGLLPGATALPPRLPNTYDWDKLSAEDQDRFDTLMAVYAATIARADQAIGRLVDRLRQTGELDNTLILFLSDNGGNAETGPDGRLEGRGPPGSARSTLFAGMNWATLQNTPFQYFKHHVHEGGIATPLIAHWPRGIAPRLRGSLVRTPGHVIDVMPTVVELSGATYPRTHAGQAIVPMEGRSMVPVFGGQPLNRATPLFWEHEGNRAVRDGRWKLVARFGQPWELYDMDRDRTELHDLAARQPARVRQMAAAWDGWAARSFVDPWRESFEPWLGKRARQNWGGTDVPRRPAAMKRTPGPDG